MIGGKKMQICISRADGEKTDRALPDAMLRIARSEATWQSAPRHSKNAIARQGNHFQLTDKLKFYSL